MTIIIIIILIIIIIIIIIKIIIIIIMIFFYFTKQVADFYSFFMVTQNKHGMTIYKDYSLVHNII